ncbi:MAG: nucleotidyl transferase AbiEii/AbiGii toxin family protein [Thermoguttaceae bacterium]|nr:nucleotidyl transferase AbiEii/AbiGii toxin family protein [Thermoguttaceae bacterium]
MVTIQEMIRQAKLEGYTDENAEAKVCQDIVLKALSESSLSRNTTIKGGVVIRSISKDARRATQDLDIDFIRYSLRDESVRAFIQQLNVLAEFHIEQKGEIRELKQQDYRGKRVYVTIRDSADDTLESKIDLGVHKKLSIKQEEYCFDIVCFEDGACLLINTKEQMFTEKLCSLLAFGYTSTRYKDVFDMCYLLDYVDIEKTKECIEDYIFSDSRKHEKTIDAIQKRMRETFSSEDYLDKMKKSRKNWLDIDEQEVFSRIMRFLEKLK